MGKPKTDAEIKKRIDDYFLFCQCSGIRPGIESLCMALHISRTMLFKWNNGTNCSRECQELIQSAKSFIGAFIEQAMLGSKISPPSGIFLMKNWLSYKDAISIEESISNTTEKRALSVAELPKLGDFKQLQSEDLPQLGTLKTMRGQKMTFKFYVEKIIQTEIKNIISNKGYVLETAFCSMLCEKYGFSNSTVISTLRKIYAKMPLTKRRMSNELKAFYGLEVKGFPIVYLPVNDTAPFPV